ncbi:MAG: hypothetical protein L0154_07580 [Chloroflexi bacterium]|nr:hypothetical protein [Chloroflexota bacterium]
MRIKITLLIIAIVIGMAIYNRASATESNGLHQEEVAQGGPTSTPAPVLLPTGSPTQPPPSETPTRTPTAAGPALVEAKNPDTNVRIGAGTDFDRVGQIQPGSRYVIRGRLFQWYQIEYPDAPSGVGWVHESVVNIIGDVAQIADLSAEELPTPDTTAASEQETLIAATQTPGGILQLTEQAETGPQGAFTATPVIGGEATLAPGERLPTFTFPPFTPTPVSTSNFRETVRVEDDEGLPPIVPIAGLAALGLMGLFYSLLRNLG